MNISGMRLWVASAAAAALLFSASPVGADSAAAAEPAEGAADGPYMDAGHWHRHDGSWKERREHRKLHRLERLKEAAEYFGIATEGKTEEQLRKELNAARKADKAKWDKYVAEREAKHLKRLQEIASKLGISTEGKSAKQLREEIRSKCKEQRQAEKGDKQ